MEVKQFLEQYIDEMAQLFVDAYSEPGYEWDIETARNYLERDYKYFPELNLMAVNESGEIMGAIFCSVDPYYKTKLLFVDSLQVKKRHREQGIGKKLLLSVIKKAKKKGYQGVHFLADNRVNFPKSWYEKLGFEKTSWVEYESGMENIKLDLLGN